MVLGIARSKIYGTPILQKLQELLLREDKLSLDKAIQICRAYEQSNKHVKELRENNSASHAINKVTHENKQPKSKKPNYKQQPRRFQDKPCVNISGTIELETNFTIVDIHKCCYFLIDISFNDGHRLF
jgi:hypothetical protein